MSTIRTRALAGAAAALSLSLVLSACGGGSGHTDSAAKTTKGNVKLEFWSWTDGIQQQVAVWNKEHPETRVTFVNAAGDTVYQKLRAAIASGNAPCLSKTDGMNLANFAADGMLTDITKAAAPYKSRYTTPAWNAVSPGGATYGIPTGSSPCSPPTARTCSRSTASRHQSDSAKIITAAASRVGEQWQYGPDYAAMYSEMQKQWGQVMNKQLTVKDMLTHLQQWVLADLKNKGVKAVAAS